jgi:hypothetical protein
MRGHMTRVLYAAAAATALITLGFGFAGTAAARVLSRSLPTYEDAGYDSYGRWFRFVSATVTIPPVIPSSQYVSNMIVALENTAPEAARAVIFVAQGGGRDSVGWGTGQTLTWFAMSPKIGDQLRVSIYYDRRGHTSFTAADLTQKITRTATAQTGNDVYNYVSLYGNSGSGAMPPPPADTRLWKVDSIRLTTYAGTHGTMTGPWQTIRTVQTSTGTLAGMVIRSPSGLSNGGASFGVWLRAVPLAYTSDFAGYTDSGGPFRYLATTLTVPTARTPAANGGTALVGLGHNGGPTPRPYANIEVVPGGGAGSISYACNAAAGTFTVNPRPGDQLRIGIYYYRHLGRYSFTVTDTTRATTQTVTVAAPYADSMPLNSADVAAMFDNGKVTRPPASTRIWQFSDTVVTTYGGDHGSILGPWATSQWIDTTTGTKAGAIMANASLLSDGCRDFAVWLQHR